ncbi:MAG: ribosomal L7Ae/L30e/S12e/Gadd45 family protein [Oscillospiraceae bacterium]|nr:ribosomal L7Ae/L30e/S12e/Gadd45 family protein [Oscillospiraceae bacterium]
MTDKLCSYLGLARRAGRLSMGNDPVLESLGKRQSSLVLAARDLSERTLRKITAAAQQAQVKLLQTPLSMEDLSYAIGKRVGIVSVNDDGFARKIEELCDQEILARRESGD